MNYREESEDNAENIHTCKGYVPVKHLPLDHSTIKRAREAGIKELLLKLSVDVLTAIEGLEIRENNYDDMARIVTVLQDICRPIQKRFHPPNIEISSFVSPDTGALITIFLTEYGIIEETVDPIKGKEVRDTDPSEIWRYLYEPRKIVENVVSTFIAVAEKHKSIREDWILSLQGIRDLCRGAGTCKI